MKLENYHEIVGTLENYEENEEDLKLHFVFKESIEIPKNVLSNDVLKECKQKR